ncbi:MAG: hypothetical protein COB93_08110 [Sneathiella sp.]|nr:MAG: hypothetical protein COB93_08110 [Sneathiella sp.]
MLERIILASSNPGDRLLDPFLGSGTTARVAQVTARRATGIEINPDYIEMAKARLAEPFTGFDSIDPRRERTSRDLPKATAKS